MKSVAPGHITMRQVYSAVTPYVIFGLVLLAFVLIWPPIATWLPTVLLGKY